MISILPENTYIMNLEASYIYKDMLEGKKIESIEKNKTKLYSATIPYSLETIRMGEMFKDFFYISNGKQFTDSIVNITFDKNYTYWDNVNNKTKVKANKKKIRTYLYENGLEIDGHKYVFYKRGAGKAKNGYAFFIKEGMRDKLIKRSRLGVVFEEGEELDLTSLLAYESLITSGIVDLIDLDPQTEIFLIDDIYGKSVTSVASVTRDIDGAISTSDESIDIRNCLSDGQGLMDESLFEKYGKEDKGFMLLRSDMFKCCAFNTKIQDWFSYNNITDVKDMFGNTYDSKKIKLITTPNSLKFLKLSYKVGDGSDKQGYNHWRENIDNRFGVVKYDSQGNYGNYNRMTYQLLNSIPNLSYEEIMDITKDEREYVELLKNDDLVFRNYILSNPKSVALFNESVNGDDMASYQTTDLINCLAMRNSDVMYTQKFKKLKTNLITNYIDNLKIGKFRIKDSKYLTIVSNPYEMLLASIGEYRDKSIMSGREVYCNYYKDGQEFCITRNPHINAGNVMYGKNQKRPEYKWFNFTKNVCAVNFFDNDMPDRLQGCDTDSDTIMTIPHELLVEKAIYCEENFTTPTNKVEGEKKSRRYSMGDLAKLDIILSENYIGKIVNMSQIINSYLNDAMSKEYDDQITDELYNLSSKLSSLSQIEIDKSKKVFDSVKMGKELSKIRKNKNIRYVKEDDGFGKQVSKMVVPCFFAYISDFNNYRVFESFKTPMDTLQDVLVFKGGKRSPNVRFSDILISPRDITHSVGRYNHGQVHIIHKIVSKYGKTLSGLMVRDSKLSEEAKANIRSSAKSKAIDKLNEYKISQATILNILRRGFIPIPDRQLSFSQYAMATLGLMFEYNKLDTMKCFLEKSSEDDEVLVALDNCGEQSYDGQTYDIFGVRYGISTIKELKDKQE